VRELLRGIGEVAPPPRPQPAEPHAIEPDDNKVTGFVFKVQANIDPQHRDRIAFLRLCSGRFHRGMKLKHHRSGRLMSIQNPVFFLARDRNLAEEAWPGDILGIPNHGTLRIGDTLTEGADGVHITGIPSFAPELLRRVRVEDPLKTKHLKRALEQLADEGVTRVFKPLSGGDWVVGVVGALQLDVLVARIKAEYDLGVKLEQAPYETARWLEADDPADLKRFLENNRSVSAEDHDGAPVYLARNAWELRRTIQDWPDLRFCETREQRVPAAR
jgi:peptide chain release factor 3